MNNQKSQRDIAEVAKVRVMIAPPGTVLVFPPNLAKARAGHDGMARIFPVLDGTVCTPLMLGGIKAEKIVPLDASGNATLLYFHGWGFSLGSIASHRHLVAQLASNSAATAYCIDYRLAPESPFPAAIDDGVEAYRALLANGILPQDVVIAGDSSGGGLAVSVALAIKAADLPQPAGLFLMSPWVDLGLRGQSYVIKADVDFMCNRAELAYWALQYAPQDGAENPLVSPVYADLTGLPAMLIHVGTEEILLSDSVSLAQAAGLAQVAVKLHIAKNMPHVWHYMWPFLTSAREAIITAGAWISAQTTGAKL
jgi:epsilon-lactone hydrolase